jgi:RNA polymerase I-specific transcription initiation factor RRN5
MKKESAWVDEPSRSRKRRRSAADKLARPRKYHLEGKYCERYRFFFNAVVQQVAARFERTPKPYAFYSWQIGSSLWSTVEQVTFFSALQRLGRDNLPAISKAVGKSIPEIRQLLLLLHGAAVKQGYAGLTFRNIPAAVEVGDECDAQVELAADALAWSQEKWEARRAQKQFGQYWLITPAVADAIEDAVNGPVGQLESRRRGGKVIIGYVCVCSGRADSADLCRACLTCKKFKKKCDRKLPCGNCSRRKIAQCIYPNSSTKTDQSENSEQPDKPEQPDLSNNPDEPKQVPSIPAILEALPEGTLLHPQNMLRLSKNIFMNRSPTIPSPWPHWSEYKSDIADEPSIYRTAFGDFHNLVLSVTQRLVLTAIGMSVSRLRRRRKRVTHDALPYVRKKDVLRAVKITGMPRNSKERWRGVARRCGLRVYDEKPSRHSRKKIKKEVPWDKFERIMGRRKWPASTLTSDWESSDDDVNPRPRVPRKGTPLPMEQLTLSDSDESSLDETTQTSRRAPQSRDAAGRYATAGEGVRRPPPLTLEQYDRKNAQIDEFEMWIMLGHNPDKSKYLYQIDEVSDEDSNEDRKIITEADDWQSFTQYRAEWEEFRTLPKPAAFKANQKPLPVPPVLQEDTIDPEESSSNDMEAPQEKKQCRRRSEPVELEAMSARAYANRKTRELAQELGLLANTASSQVNDMSGDSGDEDDDKGRRDHKQSAYHDDENINESVQSSETRRRPAVDSDDEVSEMDWSAFQD